MPVSYRFWKRVMDIALSFIVAGVLLPFMPYIIYRIKRESPGPIFFKQARTGLNGKTFMMYKFRTMHVNKEADTKQATRDDKRKFPFGQFLRRTTLDEMPQLIWLMRNIPIYRC